MSTVEIPLSPTPQTFQVSLLGKLYQFTLKWNTPAQAWVLDIDDAVGNAMVHGMALVTGGDLLEQYEYLGIGGQLVVQTDNDPQAQPTFDNLGSTSHLYFVTP